MNFIKAVLFVKRNENKLGITSWQFARRVISRKIQEFIIVDWKIRRTPLTRCSKCKNLVLKNVNFCDMCGQSIKKIDFKKS